MCSGGKLLADFTAGTEHAPDVPPVVRECLTETADGRWIVWAHKLARPAGDRYAPLTGGGSYPVDATAQCRVNGRHEAPQPHCTCGFHAVCDPQSDSTPGTGVDSLLSMISPRFAWQRQMTGYSPELFGLTALEVVLSGRVLAFEWLGRGILFRAARQTVVRVWPAPPPPPELDDPGGVLAHTVRGRPKGAGPRRLLLPSAPPVPVDILDEAGFCLAMPMPAVPEMRMAAYC